jgi:hypothetical protein
MKSDTLSRALEKINISNTISFSWQQNKPRQYINNPKIYYGCSKIRNICFSSLIDAHVQVITDKTLTDSKSIKLNTPKV